MRQFDACGGLGWWRRDDPEPAGCRCGEVITGRCTPADCGLFGQVLHAAEAGRAVHGEQRRDV